MEESRETKEPQRVQPIKANTKSDCRAPAPYIAACGDYVRTAQHVYTYY